jgi:hypothetical protein
MTSNPITDPIGRTTPNSSTITGPPRSTKDGKIAAECVKPELNHVRSDLRLNDSKLPPDPVKRKVLDKHLDPQLNGKRRGRQGDEPAPSVVAHTWIGSTISTKTTLKETVPPKPITLTPCNMK